MKKAQISIFVIVGVILVLLSFLAYSYFSDDNESNTETVLTQSANQDISDLKNYVEDCLYKTAESAILFNAIHGGIYDIQNNQLTVNLNDTEMYVVKGESSYPTLTDLELDLGKFVDRRIDLCLDNFKPFRERYNLDYGSPKTEVNIGEKVFFTLKYPLTVTSDSSKLTEDTFLVSLPYSYRLAYDSAVEISEIQTNTDSKYFFELGNLHMLSLDNNFAYEVNPIGNNTYIVAMVFGENEDTELIFNFGMGLVN